MTKLHPWIERLDDRTLLVTFPSGRTQEDIVAFWRAMDAHCEGGDFPDRFGVILDLTRVATTDPRGRALLVEHIRAHDVYYQAHCVGLAVVIRSLLVRGVFQAASWLIPYKPAPAVMVDSVEAARDWLARAHRRRG